MTERLLLHFTSLGRKWYLFVVLTHISLITNAVEHLFICLLAICISSLRIVFSDVLPI